jgi:hypothetical protein
MDEMTEVSSAAPQVPVEVSAWYSLVVAWFNQKTLSSCRLLLLSNYGIDCGLRLLLLRS